jgi:hypothetical protein
MREIRPGPVVGAEYSRETPDCNGSWTELALTETSQEHLAARAPPG